MERHLYIGDKKLIEQIRQYDPQFDYEQWKKTVELKQSFFLSVRYHPLLELYDKVKRDGITIGFYDHNVNIISVDQHAISTIVSILKKNDYRVESYDGDIITSTDTTRLRQEMTKIWLWKQGDMVGRMNDLTYNNTIKYIEQYNMQYVASVANILHIPVILFSYYEYAKQRYEDDQSYREHELYPLYTMLQSYDWSIVPYHLIVHNVDTNVEPIKNKLKELGEYIGESVDNRAIFSIKNDGLILLLMDRFYHPYIVQWYDRFY